MQKFFVSALMSPPGVITGNKKQTSMSWFQSVTRIINYYEYLYGSIIKYRHIKNSDNLHIFMLQKLSQYSKNLIMFLFFFFPKDEVLEIKLGYRRKTEAFRTTKFSKVSIKFICIVFPFTFPLHCIISCLLNFLNNNF